MAYTGEVKVVDVSRVSAVAITTAITNIVGVVVTYMYSD